VVSTGSSSASRPASGLSEQAGLKTVLAKHKPRPSLLAKLPELAIAPEFQKYPPEQLCCTSIDFVGQKQ